MTGTTAPSSPWIDDSVREALFEAAITLAVFVAAWFFLIRRGKPTRARDGSNGGHLKTGARSPVIATTQPVKKGQARMSPQTALSPASTAKIAEMAGAEQSYGAETQTILAAVRAGRAADVPVLLDTCLSNAEELDCGPGRQDRARRRGMHCLAVALRACVAKQYFAEALAVYDAVAGRLGEASSEDLGVGVKLGSVWSLLLYAAVMARAYDRCESIIARLRVELPFFSCHDFLNAVRFLAHRRDLPGLERLAADVCRSGRPMDNLTLNRALAACMAEGAMDLASSLCASASAGLCSEPMDVVSYNTLMKGFSRAGQLVRCFSVKAAMVAAGVQASEVTYGVLLDACIDARDFEGAKTVFVELSASHLQPNAVHCTTLIKGLIGAGQLKEADGVLSEMLESSRAIPDLITYSTLIRAHALEGNACRALAILSIMAKQGVQPDEILFNGVLNACCGPVTMPSAKITSVFNQLVTIGLTPTTTTLSILLKALGRNGAWAIALDTLREAPERFRLQPEPRLYAQLVQACIKGGDIGRCVQTYAGLVDAHALLGAKVDDETNNRLLRCSATCGAFSLSCALYDAIVRAGGQVDPKALSTVRDSAARRGKTHLLVGPLRPLTGGAIRR